MLKTVHVTDPNVTVEPNADSEPFTARKHSPEEIADYSAGGKSGEFGE
jgi:hypothetical protein